LPQFAGTAIDWLYLTVFISISIYFLYPKKRIFILPILLLGLTQVTALKEQDRGLDFGTTYTYLVDELKTPQRLLLGTGPSRFSIFFGRHFDGIETEVNSVPNNAQSLLLTLLCTTGLVGILSILSIYIYIYKNISKNIDVDEKLTKYIKSIYLFTALASLLLPLSTNCIITFHIITIYFTTYIKESRIIIPLKTVQLPNKKTQLVFYNTIKALILAPMLFLLFWQLRSFVADYHLDRYNQQAKKGQSLFAYNSIRSAISTYPYRADLHTQYSLVNLVLADKLTSEGISEQQDQANILGLYQQAIREATTATTLESGNYIYWKNLGIIYRELISVASNSYTYSEAAYTNAIKIAPQNPSLWLDLGVVYYKAGLFDRSCEVTSKAIELKSDWYQPHANLGLCLNKLGQTNLAKSHLETALSLTKPDSPEYQKIAEDLKNFN
jgi:Flp pilus assembly protein TadD